MLLVKTAQDLGQAIRSRRKALGWNQARLAKEIGVSRQWLIDIERGKPRAELGLVLRALYTLDLSLHVAEQDANPEATLSASVPSNHSRSTLPLAQAVDIHRIVEQHASDYRLAQQLPEGIDHISKSLDVGVPEIEKIVREHDSMARLARQLEGVPVDIEKIMREHDSVARLAKQLGELKR